MERREGNGTQRKTARTTGSGVDAATQWTRCGVVLRGVALRRTASRRVRCVPRCERGFRGWLLKVSGKTNFNSNTFGNVFFLFLNICLTSSAITEGRRDALCQLNSCQLLHKRTK